LCARLHSHIVITSVDNEKGRKRLQGGPEEDEGHETQGKKRKRLSQGLILSSLFPCRRAQDGGGKSKSFNLLKIKDGKEKEKKG